MQYNFYLKSIQFHIVLGRKTLDVHVSEHIALMTHVLVLYTIVLEMSDDSVNFLPWFQALGVPESTVLEDCLVTAILCRTTARQYHRTNFRRLVSISFR